MERKLFLALVFTLSACVVPVDTPPDPTPILPDATQQTPPTLTEPSATTIIAPAFPDEILFDDISAFLAATPEQTDANLCSDTRGLQSLLDFRAAIQTRNGAALASLVNPVSGLGVTYIRDGNVITYFENIKFIFETTYEADWGLGAGSGEPVTGSFQGIIMPSLDLVLASNPLVTCNQLKAGGATYTPEFPYKKMDFYSLHFPGTEQYGYLDWETWAIGMVRQESKPMFAALVRYTWEP